MFENKNVCLSIYTSHLEDSRKNRVIRLLEEVRERHRGQLEDIEKKGNLPPEVGKTPAQEDRDAEDRQLEDARQAEKTYEQAMEKSVGFKSLRQGWAENYTDKEGSDQR